MIKFILSFTKRSFFILARPFHLVQTWEKTQTCPKKLNFPNENSFLQLLKVKNLSWKQSSRRVLRKSFSYKFILKHLYFIRYTT